MFIFKSKEDVISSYYNGECVPAIFKKPDYSYWVDEMISKKCGYEDVRKCSDISIKNGWDGDMAAYQADLEWMKKLYMEEWQKRVNSWLTTLFLLQYADHDINGIYEGLYSDYENDQIANLAKDIIEYCERESHYE